MRVVPVATLFGEPAEDGREFPLQRALAEDPLDFGRVDLVLYLRISTPGGFTASNHALLPSATREWADLVRGHTPALVLDHAHEGPQVTDSFARRIDRLIEETGLPPEAIWFAQTNQKFARRLKGLPTASPAAKSIAHIDSHRYASAVASRAQRHNLAELGRANLNAVQASGRKVLLCLNGAPRPHRVALAYSMAHHPHRDRIFITFHAAVVQKLEMSVSVSRAATLLKAAGMQAADLVPFLSAHAFDVDASPDNVIGRRELTFSPELYRGTRASLVTETDLSNGSVARYTEKSLKPLLMGHPLLVVGNPGTLPLLEELGFDVLRDVIPADYDGIANPRARFRAALDVAGRLLAEPPDDPWPPAIKERLLANIALFEGPLLDRLRLRERQSIEAAARRMG